MLEPVVYHLNPSKSDTPLFRKIVGWTPSAISSYAAYAFKVNVDETFIEYYIILANFYDKIAIENTLVTSLRMNLR